MNGTIIKPGNEPTTEALERLGELRSVKKRQQGISQLILNLLYANGPATLETLVRKTCSDRDYVKGALGHLRSAGLIKSPDIRGGRWGLAPDWEQTMANRGSHSRLKHPRLFVSPALSNGTAIAEMPAREKQAPADSDLCLLEKIKDLGGGWSLLRDADGGYWRAEPLKLVFVNAEGEMVAGGDISPRSPDVLS